MFAIRKTLEIRSVLAVFCLSAALLSGCGLDDNNSPTGASSTSSAAPGASTETSVDASTAGSASLSWEAPTLNTDGTPVTDLAGYHIYYGTSVGALNSLIDVPGTATTEYEISNLSSGTYYFIVVAYNSLGFESPTSNQASKTI
jgi:hypothetical protein